jgi:hypothetical protein
MYAFMKFYFKGPCKKSAGCLKFSMFVTLFHFWMCVLIMLAYAVLGVDAYIYCILFSSAGNPLYVKTFTITFDIFKTYQGDSET